GGVDLDADLLDDGFAEFEAVADRPVGMIEERERQRALAIAEPHGVALLDVGERGAKPLAAGLRGCGCGKQTCRQQQASREYRPPSERVHGSLPSMGGRNGIACNRIAGDDVIGSELM